jgi:hypothetical protein
VAALCRSVGEWEGRPVDIEWGFENGELFLLQTRPITAVPLEPTERPPRGETWIREPRFDSPIDPLTFTAWLPIHGDTLEAMFSRFGVPMKRVTSRRYLGRVYFRTEPLLHGNDRTAPPEPVLKLLMRLVPPIRKRLKVAEEAGPFRDDRAALDRWDQGERERTRAETRRLRELDLTAMDDGDLSAHLGRVLDHVRQVALHHFEVMFAGTLIPTGQLGMFVEEKLGWSAAEAIGLVSGYGSASLEHGRALAEVAARLGTEGIARAVADPGILLDDPEMDAYLDRFGHRMGMSLSMPTEAEAPATIGHHLRRFAAGRPSGSIPPSTPTNSRPRPGRCSPTLPTSRSSTGSWRWPGGAPYGDETEGDTPQRPRHRPLHRPGGGPAAVVGPGASSAGRTSGSSRWTNCGRCWRRGRRLPTSNFAAASTAGRRPTPFPSISVPIRYPRPRRRRSRPEPDPSSAP